MEKPTMRLEMTELFKTNFSAFDILDENVKLEQIAKINYIETIAHSLEKNLQGINLMEILKNNNNIILATDSEINEALINFDRSEFVTEEVVEPTTLGEDDIEKIEDVCKNITENRKLEARRGINKFRSFAATKYEEYLGYMQKVCHFRRELKNVENMDAGEIIEKINTLLANPKFELDYLYDHGVISVTTKDDIINTYKNPRAGVDLRVNLGKFKIRVSFVDELSVSVETFTNNIHEPDGYYHPHLSRDGSVCFGNMKELYHEAVENKDINGVCEIVLQVLQNYYDEEPFVPLISFAEASKQVQPNGQRVVMEPRYQIHECHDCGHDIEIEFPPEGRSDYVEGRCYECDNYNEYEYDYHRD